MAKKKKAQLNPVARGFATTSQPSKRAIAEAQEAAAIAKSEATAVSTSEPTPEQTSSVTPTGDPSALNESKALDFEEQIWQDMVDRWQNKTDREIARNIQVNLLTSSTALAIDRVVLDHRNRTPPHQVSSSPASHPRFIVATPHPRSSRSRRGGKFEAIE